MALLLSFLPNAVQQKGLALEVKANPVVPNQIVRFCTIKRSKTSTVSRLTFNSPVLRCQDLILNLDHEWSPFQLC